MRCLYVVNKRAKKAADAAQEAYRSNDYGRATQERERKERLYGLKASVLNTLSPDAADQRLHTIHGTTYYYLVFEVDGKEWGFHAPTSQVALADEPTESKRLDDFEKDATIEAVDVAELDCDPEQYLAQYLSSNGSIEARIEQVFA